MYNQKRNHDYTGQQTGIQHQGFLKIASEQFDKRSLHAASGALNAQQGVIKARLRNRFQPADQFFNQDTGYLINLKAKLKKICKVHFADFSDFNKIFIVLQGGLVKLL
jgi:hypothetical protein